MSGFCHQTLQTPGPEGRLHHPVHMLTRSVLRVALNRVPSSSLPAASACSHWLPAAASSCPPGPPPPPAASAAALCAWAGLRGAETTAPSSAAGCRSEWLKRSRETLPPLKRELQAYVFLLGPSVVWRLQSSEQHLESIPAFSSCPRHWSQSFCRCTWWWTSISSLLYLPETEGEKKHTHTHRQTQERVSLNTKEQSPSRYSVHLHTAELVQNDISSFLHEIFGDVVRQRVGSKDKPALCPILPFVSLLHHIALQNSVKSLFFIIYISF